MNVRRVIFIALVLSVLGASLLTARLTHTDTMTHRTVSVGKSAAFAGHFYWNGVVITLNRNDELLAALGLVPVTALLAVFGPGGDFAALGSATGVGHAWWDYNNHQCDWYWIPYPSYGTASMGTYSC